MEASAVARQASSPVSLSSICFIMDSNPSSFDEKSSMKVITADSNLVGFFCGARASTDGSRKIFGWVWWGIEAMDTNC